MVWQYNKKPRRYDSEENQPRVSFSMGLGKLVSHIYVSASNDGTLPTGAVRRVVTNCPGQEQPGRSASFLRLTSCRETRRICRERFWERGRYLVAETTVSYDQGVASTSLLASEKVVHSQEKLLALVDLLLKRFILYSSKISLINIVKLQNIFLLLIKCCFFNVFYYSRYNR